MSDKKIKIKLSGLDVLVIIVLLSYIGSNIMSGFCNFIKFVLNVIAVSLDKISKILFYLSNLI